MKQSNPEDYKRLNIGENIFYWRKLKGIKQEDLAQQIGISSAALSNIENGNSNPSIERLESIANALGIELQHLFTNPQQIFNFNNSPLSNGVIYGSNTQNHYDQKLVDKILSLIDRLTDFFESNIIQKKD